MKTTGYTTAAVKAILLRDKYPNGNAEHLMDHTDLVHNPTSISLRTYLDRDHWAFTCKEEPKPRYRLRKNGEDVFDSVTGETLGYMCSAHEAEDYMVFLNERLKRNQG